MSLAIDHIRALLIELNDALILEGTTPQHWLVCGGTALAMQGLSDRTTRDIDVLGGWNAGGLTVAAIDVFSPMVSRATRRVADAHPELQGVKHAWVNLGPQLIVKHGLPKGFAERLASVRIGSALTLHLLGRRDLIALKLFAASDELGGRQQIHRDDLRRLGPTAAELNASIEWALRMPDPENRLRSVLKELVQELGHEDLAYYL